MTYTIPVNIDSSAVAETVVTEINCAGGPVLGDPVIERAFEVPFVLERSEDEGDGLTLEGYAAVFNKPARIQDSEGEYDEVILPGAFNQGIKSKSPVRLMFNHGRNALWENMPIGKIQELREDPRGLYVKARLSDNWLIHPIRDAIRDGAIEGMSFRFEPRKQEWTGRGNSRLRTHREVHLHELGPVTFPAYTETTVAIRSLERTVPNLTLVLRDETPGTSDEAAPVSTSDEAAETGEPAPSHSPSTFAERQQRARRIEMSRKGIGKAT